VVAATAPSGTIARPARLFKLSGPLATVVETARLYNCARCHCQVVICRPCDNGNVYCRSCAPVAGLESHRRADAAYQKTDQGRKNHKARQQRYLEKMTDKGSPGSRPASPSRANAEAATSASAKEERDACSSPSPATTTQPAGAARRSDGDSGHSCDFCGRVCSAYLRLETLAHCTVEEDGDDSVPVPGPRLERPRHCAAPRSASLRRAAPDRTRSPPALL
jgi:hypothetical protein